MMLSMRKQEQNVTFIQPVKYHQERCSLLEVYKLCLGVTDNFVQLLYSLFEHVNMYGILLLSWVSSIYLYLYSLLYILFKSYSYILDNGNMFMNTKISY